MDGTGYRRATAQGPGLRAADLLDIQNASGDLSAIPPQGLSGDPLGPHGLRPVGFLFSLGTPTSLRPCGRQSGSSRPCRYALPFLIRGSMQSCSKSPISPSESERPGTPSINSLNPCGLVTAGCFEGRGTGERRPVCSCPKDHNPL